MSDFLFCISRLYEFLCLSVKLNSSLTPNATYLYLLLLYLFLFLSRCSRIRVSHATKAAPSKRGSLNSWPRNFLHSQLEHGGGLPSYRQVRRVSTVSKRHTENDRERESASLTTCSNLNGSKRAVKQEIVMYYYYNLCFKPILNNCWFKYIFYLR